MSSHDEQDATRNRTMVLSEQERHRYGARLLHVEAPLPLRSIADRTILGDTFAVLAHLPDCFADLIFADPPYNLDKTFQSLSFTARNMAEYAEWLDGWVAPLVRLLKPNGSMYLCGDWRSSSAIQAVLEKYFIVRNRITWEREKGRGAKANWKNCSEDIWFATASNRYTFNVDDVKLRRRVIAPYRTDERQPKDWQETDEGNFRLTYPSNLWTDLTVPFWSMSENTVHPTQKPEKLLAKIILASSNPGDVVFDPFLGSGTTSVVAKKLKRHFVGIELDPMYACLAEKRLALAETDSTIQGYTQGYFWERNSAPPQNSRQPSSPLLPAAKLQESLLQDFD
jgi:site-specific DNA-methyltransferase (adenine-specific)